MYYFYLKSDLNTYSWDNRSVYGDFYIEIDNITFPNDGWSDIISSVLDMWIDNVIKLLESDFKTTVELNFMDGPYYLEVSCRCKDILEVHLFSRDIKVYENPFEVSFYNFLSEIIKVTSNMLRYQRLENVSSIKKLNKKYRELISVAKYKGYQF